LQNFTQEDLTEVKIFQTVLGGYFFLKHPVHVSRIVSKILNVEYWRAFELWTVEVIENGIIRYFLSVYRCKL